MRIPDPYFENVPCYGNLSMEQIIVEYVYPLLSVLKDKQGNRYLCICFDTRGAQQWIITPISTTDLVDLLQNRLTLSAPFEKKDSHKVHVVRSYEEKRETFTLLDADKIPEENLPTKGEFLDAEVNEWDEYIATIKVNDAYVLKKVMLVAARVEPTYRVNLARPRRNNSHGWREINTRQERARMCYV